VTGVDTFKSALHSFFLENLWLKLFSLFIGFTLWFFISSEQVADRIVEVPVEILNKPLALEIANDYTKSVLVQIQTSQLNKESFSKNIVATLDLSTAHQGENVILLTPGNFRAPSPVTILNIRPPTVTVILEPLQSKTVPIKVRRSGQLAANLSVTGIFVYPETVVISGPASHVANVNDISTQTIDISGQRNTLVRFVNLVAENPFISISFQSRVRVEIQIQERTISRMLYRQTIGVRDLNGPVRLQRTVADVLVKVPVSQGELLQPGSVQIYIDGADCKSDLVDQEVPIHFQIVNPALVNSLTIEKIEPEKIWIRVLAKSARMKTGE